MLTSEVENLRMQEFETIWEFYSKLCDLSNQTYALGEEYSNTKLVGKVLRSLPKRYSIKVIAIEEAKDFESLSTYKLIGSLHTFEMNFKEVKCSRKKR